MEHTSHTQGLQQPDHHGHLNRQLPSKVKEQHLTANHSPHQGLATNLSLKCQATNLRLYPSTQEGICTLAPQDPPYPQYQECTHNPP